MKQVISLGLSLGMLMLNAATTHCMEQRADHEATTENVVTTQELVPHEKPIGPQLPSKKEAIKQFTERAAEVSLMGIYGISSSPAYAEMQEARKTVLTLNKGDKAQTAADLFDGYTSADDEYYASDFDNEEITGQRIKALNATLSFKLEPKIDKNNKQRERLEKQKKALDEGIDALLRQRANLRASFNELAQENETLQQVRTIITNNKERENSLLGSRKERLIAAIKELDERLEKHKNDANPSSLVDLLEHDVDKSVVAEATKEVKDFETKLLGEKQQLEEKLQKIEKVLASLESKQGNWLFPW